MAKIGRQGDGGGRPLIVFTPEQVVQVEKLAAVLSKDQLADYFGIGETTLYEIEKRQPEVYEAYKRGKAKAIGSVGSSLLSQCKNGNVSAMIFYLKTQARWKDTTTVEHSSPDGTIQPLTVRLIGPDDGTT